MSMVSTPAPMRLTMPSCGRAARTFSGDRRHLQQNAVAARGGGNDVGLRPAVADDEFDAGVGVERALQVKVRKIVVG